VFWHPKGARMRVLMEEYWRRKHTEQGYEMLFTPHVAKLDLWKTSGHYDFYRENMFDQVCAHHATVLGHVRSGVC